MLPAVGAAKAITSLWRSQKALKWATFASIMSRFRCTRVLAARRPIKASTWKEGNGESLQQCQAYALLACRPPFHVQCYSMRAMPSTRMTHEAEMSIYATVIIQSFSQV